MLDVPIAMRDHVAKRTSLLTVPIGTRLSDVLDGLGIPIGDVLVRAGDFLRDEFAPPDAVVGGGGELTLQVTARQIPENPDPCLRCGWCVEACPTRINPAGLLEASQRDDADLAEHFGLPACIECGICTYVCPSRLPLLTSIRRLRQDAVALPGEMTSVE